MTISAQIICDSIGPAGVRLTTFLLKFPRFILAEVGTHRSMSRNAASSRAIPVKKMIEMVINDPVHPVWWGKSQAGMQAREELTGWRRWCAKQLWFKSRWVAVAIAWVLVSLGLHKQLANRILEPWMYITVVMTATDWKNFFFLRTDEDAQPEFRILAGLMALRFGQSKPIELQEGEWHLPFISVEDRNNFDLETLAKISAARCARTSYLTHDGKRDPQKDLELFDRLMMRGETGKPVHASPTEHQAMATSVNHGPSGNFRGGWVQFRKTFKNEAVKE